MPGYGIKRDQTAAPIHRALDGFKDVCSYGSEEVVDLENGHVVVYYNVCVKLGGWDQFPAHMAFQDVQYLPKQHKFHLNHGSKKFSAIRLARIRESSSVVGENDEYRWQVVEFVPGEPHFYYTVEAYSNDSDA